VGYCGGTTKDPDYQHIGDHAETVEIDFDPEKITYAELLKQYFSAAPCSHKSYSKQYASIIFCANAEQRKIAETAKADLEKQRGTTVHAEIHDLDHFYMAEDYHQKYYLRHTAELMRDFQQRFASQAEFRDSTAVARANGYIGHFGDAKQLKEEIEKLGLSEAAQKWLLAHTR